VVVAPIVALLPDLELGLFLEDADEDWRLRVHALLAEEHHRVLRQGTQVWSDVDLARARRKHTDGRQRCERVASVLEHVPQDDPTHTLVP
jgi:hypothetical protein